MILAADVAYDEAKDAATAAGVGLGRHLYLAMERRTAIVGVAKTPYTGAPAAEVRRGNSDSPLFVTAAGLELGIASGAVASMHGNYRIPTMLKAADALSRRR